jgi:hypothetical protein
MKKFIHNASLEKEANVIAFGIPLEINLITAKI